jgi:hypothetical protein
MRPRVGSSAVRIMRRVSTRSLPFTRYPMTTTRADWFWKAWATAFLLLLAKLAFAGPTGVPRPDLSLVRPLHAQEVAIGGNVVCTSAANGTVLYCWTMSSAANGPAIKWYGAFRVPNS